jgi:adenylate kinase
MKVIIITGTPCTGKTTLAKRISKERGLLYIDANEVIRKNNLRESYDRKNRCYVVDEKKLGKALATIIKRSKRDIIIDSHMSHYAPSDLVDLCIVTKCSLKALKRRLESRGYPKAKVRDNLDSEIFDICLNEATELGHKVKVVDTSKRYSIRGLF